MMYPGSHIITWEAGCNERIRKQNIAARNNSESENTATRSMGNGINVQRDIQFCSYVAWRLGYLLSHPNISFQSIICFIGLIIHRLGFPR
jgi:hypothetical protein